MVSQYSMDKYSVLKAIFESCDTFDDIVWYTNMLPIRVRGILRYFMTRNDIKKYNKKPSRYTLTEKGIGKLQHWEKTKNS